MRAPQTYYHYTTADGLVGIVGTQSIRATNFSFLNDSTEISYGLGVINRVLTEVPSGMRLLLDSVSEALRGYADLADTYVACFSARPDDLSQWRGYGATEVDRYCIGFSADSLVLRPTAVAHTATATQPRQVIYSLDRQLQIAKDLIGSRLRVTGPLNQALTPWAIALELLEAASTFKDPAFAAENEWRTVISNLNRKEMAVQFGVRGGRVRPFVTLHMADAGSPLPITDVYLLPYGRVDQALKATRLVLAQNGYSPSLVRLSTVPFVG